MPKDGDVGPISTVRILHSWLCCTAVIGNISSELWQSMQGSRDLVLMWWEMFWKNGTYQRAWDQNQWELVENHPVIGETRLFLFGGFSSLTTLCRGSITCNVHSMMTSWREELWCFKIVARLRKRTFWKLLCVKPLPMWTKQSRCIAHRGPVQGR